MSGNGKPRRYFFPGGIRMGRAGGWGGARGWEGAGEWEGTGGGGTLKSRTRRGLWRLSI